jgi:hypothetical protein
MIKNAIVLGAARSGTSLLAGLFHGSGYFSGDRLLSGTVSNPLGHFEDPEIQGINQDLLHKVAPWRPRGIFGTVLPMLRDRPKWGQLGVLALPAGTVISSDPRLDKRMAALTCRQPYLFKDPRFSYTLTLWRAHLADDTIFLCIFREPQRTVNSIMMMARTELFLRDLRMTREKALQYWEAAYRSVLHQRSLINGEWYFLHYDELLSQRAVPLLEDRLGARADLGMIRPELKRSSMDGPSSQSADHLYNALVELAEAKYTTAPAAVAAPSLAAPAGCPISGPVRNRLPGTCQARPARPLPARGNIIGKS